MRGADITREELFVMRKTADYVPTGHPLITICKILNHALRGLVLQALYGIRSERLLCEQLGYKCGGAHRDSPVNDAAIYPCTKSRARSYTRFLN